MHSHGTHACRALTLRTSTTLPAANAIAAAAAVQASVVLLELSARTVVLASRLLRRMSCSFDPLRCPARYTVVVRACRYVSTVARRWNSD